MLAWVLKKFRNVAKHLKRFVAWKKCPAGAAWLEKRCREIWGPNSSRMSGFFVKLTRDEAGLWASMCGCLLTCPQRSMWVDLRTVSGHFRFVTCGSSFEDGWLVTAEDLLADLCHDVPWVGHRPLTVWVEAGGHWVDRDKDYINSDICLFKR